MLHDLDPETPFNVLHIGPGLADTVRFFADYRCRLFFVDLFDYLPVVMDPDATDALDDRFRDWLNLPAGITLDLCLFWDYLDYLDAEAIAALVRVLRHSLGRQSRGHAYTVRSAHAEPGGDRFGIADGESVSLHRRSAVPPGYQPHSQRQLQQLLNCFTFERSVLLSDGRLELALRAKL